MANNSSQQTPGSSSVLNQLKELESHVVERIRELAPLEQELADLRATAERLGLQVGPDTTSRGDRPAAATDEATELKAPRRRRTTSSSPKRRAGQARPRGSRAEDVVKAVSAQPGITVAEVGKQLGVDSTGLYRVVSKLEADGHLKKDGRKLQPVT